MPVNSPPNADYTDEHIASLLHLEQKSSVQKYNAVLSTADERPVEDYDNSFFHMYMEERLQWYKAEHEALVRERYLDVSRLDSMLKHMFGMYEHALDAEREEEAPLTFEAIAEAQRNGTDVHNWFDKKRHFIKYTMKGDNTKGYQYLWDKSTILGAAYENVTIGPLELHTLANDALRKFSQKKSELKWLQAYTAEQLWEQELEALAAALPQEFRNNDAVHSRPDFDVVPELQWEKTPLVQSLGFSPQEAIRRSASVQAGVSTGKRRREQQQDQETENPVNNNVTCGQQAGQNRQTDAEHEARGKAKVQQSQRSVASTDAHPSQLYDKKEATCGASSSGLKIKLQPIKSKHNYQERS